MSSAINMLVTKKISGNVFLKILQYDFVTKDLSVLKNKVL